MFISKLLRFIKNPQPYIDNIISISLKKNKIKKRKQAENFFLRKNILKFFQSGNTSEIKPDFLDLQNLYQTIILRKPKCVLEFGVGFSTISILLALDENKKLNHFGKLYVVDPEKKWINNTMKKIPEHLKKFVTFNYSKASINIFQGQLVSMFENLPDITPDLILLDGPNPQSVKGNIKGLKFSSGRPIIASDILLYESTSPINLFIIVDGRYKNAIFLKNHLKHKYKFRQNLAYKRFTFEKIT